jgi:hypothetical protein
MVQLARSSSKYERKAMIGSQRDYSGGGSWRIAKPPRRKDENNDAYDVTRVFMEELIRHPFAAHDDFIDAVSRYVRRSLSGASAL